MKKIQMKNYNKTLTEKQQKYHRYHQAESKHINILRAGKFYLLIKVN